jgi:hypothetical protein
MSSVNEVRASIAETARQVNRVQDLTEAYVLDYARTTGMIGHRDSLEEATASELNRLNDWLHALVDVEHADVQRLFYVIGYKNADARVAFDDERFEDVIAANQIAARAFKRLSKICVKLASQVKQGVLL